MQKETAGQREFRDLAARALRLLEEGYSPEEVERMLHPPDKPFTALSDPNNVLMQEVTEDGTGRS